MPRFLLLLPYHKSDDKHGNKDHHKQESGNEYDVALLRGLEAQIAQLGETIDRFSRERGALAEIIPSSKAQRRQDNQYMRRPILQYTRRADSDSGSDGQSESEWGSGQSTPTRGTRAARSFTRVSYFLCFNEFALKSLSFVLCSVAFSPYPPSISRNLCDAHFSVPRFTLTSNTHALCET